MADPLSAMSVEQLNNCLVNAMGAPPAGTQPPPHPSMHPLTHPKPPSHYSSMGPSSLPNIPVSLSSLPPHSMPLSFMFPLDYNRPLLPPLPEQGTSDKLLLPPSYRSDMSSYRDMRQNPFTAPLPFPLPPYPGDKSLGPLPPMPPIPPNLTGSTAADILPPAVSLPYSFLPPPPLLSYPNSTLTLPSTTTTSGATGNSKLSSAETGSLAADEVSTSPANFEILSPGASKLLHSAMESDTDNLIPLSPGTEQIPPDVVNYSKYDVTKSPAGSRILIDVVAKSPIGCTKTTIDVAKSPISARVVDVSRSPIGAKRNVDLSMTKPATSSNKTLEKAPYSPATACMYSTLPKKSPKRQKKQKQKRTMPTPINSPKSVEQIASRPELPESSVGSPEDQNDFDKTQHSDIDDITNFAVTKKRKQVSILAPLSPSSESSYTSDDYDDQTTEHTEYDQDPGSMQSMDMSYDEPGTNEGSVESEEYSDYGTPASHRSFIGNDSNIDGDFKAPSSNRSYLGHGEAKLDDTVVPSRPCSDDESSSEEESEEEEKDKEEESEYETDEEEGEKEESVMNTSCETLNNSNYSPLNQTKHFDSITEHRELFVSKNNGVEISNESKISILNSAQAVSHQHDAKEVKGPQSEQMAHSADDSKVDKLDDHDSVDKIEQQEDAETESSDSDESDEDDEDEESDESESISVKSPGVASPATSIASPAIAIASPATAIASPATTSVSSPKPIAQNINETTNKSNHTIMHLDHEQRSSIALLKNLYQTGNASSSHESYRATQSACMYSESVDVKSPGRSSEHHNYHMYDPDHKILSHEIFKADQKGYIYKHDPSALTPAGASDIYMKNNSADIRFNVEDSHIDHLQMGYHTKLATTLEHSHEASTSQMENSIGQMENTMEYSSYTIEQRETFQGYEPTSGIPHAVLQDIIYNQKYNQREETNVEPSAKIQGKMPTQIDHLSSSDSRNYLHNEAILTYSVPKTVQSLTDSNIPVSVESYDEKIVGDNYSSVGSALPSKPFNEHMENSYDEHMENSYSEQMENSYSEQMENSYSEQMENSYNEPMESSNDQQLNNKYNSQIEHSYNETIQNMDETRVENSNSDQVVREFQVPVMKESSSGTNHQIIASAEKNIVDQSFIKNLNKSVPKTKPKPRKQPKNDIQTKALVIKETKTTNRPSQPPIIIALPKMTSQPCKILVQTIQVPPGGGNVNNFNSQPLFITAVPLSSPLNVSTTTVSSAGRVLPAVLSAPPKGELQEPLVGGPHNKQTQNIQEKDNYVSEYNTVVDTMKNKNKKRIFVSKRDVGSVVLPNPVQDGPATTKGLYCVTCNKMYHEGCPEHNQAYNHLTDTTVLSRARMSVPKQLALRSVFNQDSPNYIGVVAKEHVPSKTVFGPLEGIKTTKDQLERPEQTAYVWELFDDGQPHLVLDCRNEELSNWLMFVKRARTSLEQNIMVYQQDEDIYFITCKDIEPGYEMLYWYARDYSRMLGVATRPEDFFRCPHCHKQFADMRAVKQHIKYLHPNVSTRKHKCNVCSRVFHTNSKLSIHMMIHLGLKPHKCQQCGKQFSDKSNYRRHMRLHTDDNRRFKCEVCGNTFTQKSHLNDHMTVHNKQQNLECRFCDRLFSRKSELRMHELRHTGESTITCGLCGKEFYKHSNYTRHLKYHSGEKDYECDWCKKRFYTNYHLKRHKETCKGEAGKEGAQKKERTKRAKKKNVTTETT